MWHAIWSFLQLFNLRHHVRVLYSLRREAKKREERSPHWRTVEKHFKEANPTCAACGTKKLLQVHHEKPFHTDPSLELDPKNLIGLCMSRYECHLRIGHGGDFKHYNPDVVVDAAKVLARPEMRNAVEAMAKFRRLVNEPGGA